MGEIADDMIERYGYPNEDGPPEPDSDATKERAAGERWE